MATTLRVAAVVTMGGADDARRSVVLSRHAGMVAARVRAAKERACGRDAIAERVEDFVAARLNAIDGGCAQFGHYTVSSVGCGVYRVDGTGFSGTPDSIAAWLVAAGGAL